VKLRFIITRGGNYHMAELLAGLCATARETGLDAGLEHSVFPRADDDTVCVFIPHEHAGLHGYNPWPSAEQRARTIPLCVENPHTSWFGDVARLAPQFPLTLAINRSSVAELRSQGISAEHLQLGYTQNWDRWGGEPRARPIDVAYLGAEDARRDRLVAGFARWWARRRTAILVPRLDPKPEPQADYLVDDAKYGLLRDSKVIVNLHREHTASFEWARVLQAIANGCVVVSEHSSDHHPLVPGEHFVAAEARAIPHIVEGLLRSPERLDAIRDSAYETVRSELPMQSTIARLAEVAAELPRYGSRPPIPPRVPAVPVPPQAAAPAPDASARTATLQGAVRTLTTETLELRRSVQRLLESSEGRDPEAGPELVSQTPAYDGAAPRVSVTITLHNYAREVLVALLSVDGSEFEDYEVLVLDDASTDDSQAAAKNFLLDHPWMPAALFSQRVNRGLGASRNSLARLARGELMFVLDADNEIYPRALGRLVGALDAERGAAFAYPLIAAHRGGDPVGLLSRYAWDPQGFRAGNYIDAMAMIRLSDFNAVGGYTEDVRLTGWEDFHLWCAFAETNRRGTLVSEVLARYRETDHSMLALIEIDLTVARSLMHDRFPALVPMAPSP
jgi:hypothetical protein